MNEWIATIQGIAAEGIILCSAVDVNPEVKPVPRNDVPTTLAEKNVNKEAPAKNLVNNLASDKCINLGREIDVEATYSITQCFFSDLTS